MMTRIPNVFHSLYSLAKAEVYDISKWHELLVNIDRRCGEKHTIKDMCLLYYSLAKGALNKDISSLLVNYKCKVTKDTRGPLSIRDISYKYIDNVIKLLEYMNAKQMVMISQSVLILNQLNRTLCDLIIKRINRKQLKQTSRSFSAIVRTLASSNHTNGDVIETLILKNTDIISQSDKFDTISLLESIATFNINNETILCHLLNKIVSFSTLLNSKELFSIFYSLYKLKYIDNVAISALYHRFRNIGSQFRSKELIHFARYLSFFKPTDIKDIFDMFLVPIIFEDSKNLSIGELLSFLLNATKIGSNISSDTLTYTLTRVEHLYELEVFFNILHERHAHHDYDVNENMLWIKSLDHLKMFTDKLINVNDSLYLLNILGYIIDSNIFHPTFPEFVFKYALDNYQHYSVDDLVEFIYRIHHTNSNLLDELLNKTLLDLNKLNLYSIIRIVSISFVKGITNENLLNKFRFVLGDKEFLNSSTDSNNHLNTSRIYRNVLSTTPSDLLEYLLFSIVLYSNGAATNNIDYLCGYKAWISYILKNIKYDNNLLFPLLYYIKSKINNELCGILPDHIHCLIKTNPILHYIYDENNPLIRNIVVEFNKFLFKPITIGSDNNLLQNNSVSERWHSIEIKLGYTLFKSIITAETS